MSKKYVDRTTILKAIRTEPLRAGSWVQRDNEGNILQNKNCKVCAVGAVLRHAGLSNEAIDDFGDDMIAYASCTPNDEDLERLGRSVDDQIQIMLDEGMYLHALSMKFESYASRAKNPGRTRKAMAKFVKKNFPKRIAVSRAF